MQKETYKQTSEMDAAVHRIPQENKLHTETYTNRLIVTMSLTTSITPSHLGRFKSIRSKHLLEMLVNLRASYPANYASFCCMIAHTPIPFCADLLIALLRRWRCNQIDWKGTRGKFHCCDEFPIHPSLISDFQNLRWNPGNTFEQPNSTRTFWMSNYG